MELKENNVQEILASSENPKPNDIQDQQPPQPSVEPVGTTDGQLAGQQMVRGLEQ